MISTAFGHSHRIRSPRGVRTPFARLTATLVRGRCCWSRPMHPRSMGGTDEMTTGSPPGVQALNQAPSRSLAHRRRYSSSTIRPSAWSLASAKVAIGFAYDWTTRSGSIRSYRRGARRQARRGGRHRARFRSTARVRGQPAHHDPARRIGRERSGSSPCFRSHRTRREHLSAGSDACSQRAHTRAPNHVHLGSRGGEPRWRNHDSDDDNDARALFPVWDRGARPRGREGDRHAR